MNERRLWWRLLWASQLTGTLLASTKEARGATPDVYERLLRRGGGTAWQSARRALGAQPAPAPPPGVLLRGDDDYPAVLSHLDVPPFGIFVRGDVELLHAEHRVAVVGSRHARIDSEHFTKSMCGQLARDGVVIVSGLARGIDGSAHRGALEARGKTLAVLGSGFDVVHPQSHRRLATRVASQGLLVSEHAPWIAARPYFFPLRNRIIAALSSYVVVVQAAERSGALITAAAASEIGRDVGAVPSYVGDVAYAGSLALLRDGCRAIVDAASVRRELGIEREALVQQHEFARLLDAPRHPDEIAEICDMSVAHVLQRLACLEIDGVVARTLDGRYANSSC